MPRSIAMHAQSNNDRPIVATLVEAIDSRLRRRHGVSEYTDCPACIFRIHIGRMAHARVLRDGVGLLENDRVVEIHFWNEQLPKMPAAGPTLGWARRFNQAFAFSLRELATYLAARSELDDVIAIRANVSVGSAIRHHQLSLILGHFGFEIIAVPHLATIRERLRRFGENILFSMMVYARNPVALRRDALRRDRAVAYLSRRALERRYGTGGGASDRPFAASQ